MGAPRGGRTIIADTSALDAVRDDIERTPETLRRFLDSHADEIMAIGRTCFRRGTTWVLTAGRGSSDNASRYGAYLLGAQRGLPVMQASPSLFTRYGNPPRLDGALVVAVSASGRSRDIVSVVEEGRRQNRPTIAVTNAPDSPVAEAADHVIALDVDTLGGHTSTRTYVTSLATYALLTAGAGDGADDDLFSELLRIPDAIEETSGEAAEIADAAAILADARRVAIVGRGYNLATSDELALRLSTTTRTAALSYSAADLLREPESSYPPSPVVLVATSGRVLSDVVDLLPPLRERGVPLVVLSDVDDVLAEADHPVALPSGIREWLSPLGAVVPVQRLAVEVAALQGVPGT